MDAVREVYIELNIRIEKTKFLKQTRMGKPPQNIKIGDDNLEKVKHFKYVGVNVNSDGRGTQKFEQEALKPIKHT